MIEHTLRCLEPLIRGPQVEVTTAANGCDDDIATIACSIDGVVVLEPPDPSKIGSLNAAERDAPRWPPLFLDADVLDADIEISPVAAMEALSMLNRREAVAGRPAFRWDLVGAC